MTYEVGTILIPLRRGRPYFSNIIVITEIIKEGWYYRALGIRPNGHITVATHRKAVLDALYVVYDRTDAIEKLVRFAHKIEEQEKNNVKRFL